MNPLAVLLLVLAVGCLFGALIVGGFNGLSLVGVLFALCALGVQVVCPREDTR